MNADELTDWLLQQKSKVVLQVLHEMVEEMRPLPDGFNWMGLGEIAADDTFRNRYHKDEEYNPFNLGWASVAVFAYNQIINEFKYGPRLMHKPDTKRLSYLSLELARMNVQVRCILQYGHLAGDPVRDVNLPVNCVFEDILFSPSDVQKNYIGKGQQNILMKKKDFVRLREKLKELLPLEREYLLPPDKRLQIWFSIMSQLDSQP